MTNDLTAAVYLNDGDGQILFGFTDDARLREAARFDITLGSGLADDAAIVGALETIFTQLNVDHPDTDWALRYRLAGYRSLSVGDVVTLAETAWACAPCGWTQLTTDQLSAALQA